MFHHKMILRGKKSNLIETEKERFTMMEKGQVG